MLNFQGNWGTGVLGLAWAEDLRFCANAGRGLGVSKSSKPSPDHSKITTKTKTLHFEVQ